MSPLHDKGPTGYAQFKQCDASGVSIAVFLLLSASLPLALAAGVTLVAVVQPQYVFFSDTLFAEGLFGLLTVLFFVVRKWRRDTVGFALCGVCVVLAYEARTAGMALLAAWVVDHVLRKERGARSSRSPSRPSSWRVGTAGSRRSSRRRNTSGPRTPTRQRPGSGST